MFTFSPILDESGELVDFRFVIVNTTMAAYVQQSPAQMEGQPGSVFFPGYLHNGVFDMYRKTFLTGETQRQNFHYNTDGLDIYLDLMSTKVGDEVLVTFTDHTALHKAQIQLESYVEELKRSNSNLEEFAHAASHDLKEPIRKVHFFSSRLKASLADRMTEDEKKFFDRMENAAARMSLLVDDLLEYSHVSFHPQEMELIDLNVKLKLVLEDLELAIEEKKAKIHIGPMPKIKGHRRQIQQLFQNLIGNALKYNKSGTIPEITINANRVRGHELDITLNPGEESKFFYLIEVRDQGIGFEQEESERIFQVFQRLHGNAEYRGTGIGLSIARKVVDNHHGKIWAESEPGKGASFKILLPADELQSSQA
jgi:light-regulated signal transduction histidine kinase (bacteriophytochrome)